MPLCGEYKPSVVVGRKDQKLVKDYRTKVSLEESKSGTQNYRLCGD